MQSIFPNTWGPKTPGKAAQMTRAFESHKRMKLLQEKSGVRYCAYPSNDPERRKEPNADIGRVV